MIISKVALSYLNYRKRYLDTLGFSYDFGNNGFRHYFFADSYGNHFYILEHNRDVYMMCKEASNFLGSKKKEDEQIKTAIELIGNATIDDDEYIDD
jgi:hypothetical protein